MNSAGAHSSVRYEPRHERMLAGQTNDLAVRLERCASARVFGVWGAWSEARARHQDPDVGYPAPMGAIMSDTGSAIRDTAHPCIHDTSVDPDVHTLMDSGLW